MLNFIVEKIIIHRVASLASEKKQPPPSLNIRCVSLYEEAHSLVGLKLVKFLSLNQSKLIIIVK